jgi:hypothetical protein
MASHRKGHRMSLSARNGQSGITAIGFLLLAVLVGIVGLAGLKLTPMYIRNMALGRILQDLQGQVGAEPISPVSIRREIDRRLEIESIDLPKDSVKIAPSKNGYTVHVTYESRAPYAAGVYLLLEFDKQVEIKK